MLVVIQQLYNVHLFLTHFLIISFISFVHFIIHFHLVGVKDKQ